MSHTMTGIKPALLDASDPEELNLSQTDFTGVEAFNGLLDIISKRTCLRKLDLSAATFAGRDDFSKFLAVLQAKKTIKELILSRTVCGEGEIDGNSLGTFVESTKTLQKLVLSGCHLGPEVIKHLTRGLAKNSSLSVLCVQNCFLDEESAALLLATGTNLRVLDIGANGPFSSSFLNTCLASFLSENKNLESLRLDHSSSMFSVDEAANLRPFLQALETNKNLKSMSLRYCRLRDDVGRAILRTLTINETLATLNLEFSGFGLRDQGNEILIQLLPHFRALRELKIITRFDATLFPRLLKAIEKTCSLEVFTARMSDSKSQGHIQSLLDRNRRLSQAKTLLGAVEVSSSLLPAAASCLSRTSAGSAATYQLLQERIAQFL